MTILSNEKNWLITNVLLINLLFKHAAIGYMCQRPAVAVRRRIAYEEDMIERQGEVLNFEGSAFRIFV